MSKFIDRTGFVYGRLTVLEKTGRRTSNGNYIWRCRCTCGCVVEVSGACLTQGSVLSCGCYQKEQVIKANTTHGLCPSRGRSRLYTIWAGMKQRCYNRKASKYFLYGGRGIKVCDEWKNSFSAFSTWALTHGYNNNLTIDRLDSDKDYTPTNCQWITLQENSRKACHVRRKSHD